MRFNPNQKIEQLRRKEQTRDTEWKKKEQHEVYLFKMQSKLYHQSLFRQETRVEYQQQQ